jgi:ribosome recycling factor
MDIKDFQLDVDKCIAALKEDLSQIHTGRAMPELVEGVSIEAYGTQSPLKNLANINAADAKSIVVQPWDKSILEAIVKAVQSSNLGFSASIEGEIVRIKIPDLTQERRMEFVKAMKERVEEARVAVRNVRQVMRENIEETEKAGMSKDEADRMRADIEKIVKAANEKIEEMKDVKEADLMKV